MRPSMNRKRECFMDKLMKQKVDFLAQWLLENTEPHEKWSGVSAQEMAKYLVDKFEEMEQEDLIKWMQRNVATEADRKDNE